ncbi:hypothetical protein [Lysobacter brunescens]|uniref:Uncharacterized protein n=1 Tax=Lysobacter brunescens TaxID=262323 RepID=A0ABW2Y8C6_9GAMM
MNPTSASVAMTESEAIQIAFPDEPNWHVVPDDVLVALVVTHQCEPSCAQSALTELKSRGHHQTGALCESLLHDSNADRWLRAGAMSILLSHHPLEGFGIALAMTDDCEAELLEEIVEALNYEHQGPLAEIVHAHPLVQRVRERLVRQGIDQVEFGALFMDNFGGNPPVG